MTIMKAPEKIYLSDFTDITEAVFYVKQDNTKETDIEYTRTDTFIEKASEYLEPILTEYAGFYVGADILQHFKNYMKGE